MRLRHGLTEEAPRIRTYHQDRWGELVDNRTAPTEYSLQILTGLHRRWALLLEAMSAADFERRVDHPDYGELSLARLTALYGWHCRHHLAHLVAGRRRMAA